jgi:hypothetical protein
VFESKQAVFRSQEPINQHNHAMQELSSLEIGHGEKKVKLTADLLCDFI